MAESFITQCPHCGTSFRVRTEQLSVANGSVRCGACLQVFSARNHVVTGSTPPAAPVAKPAPAAAVKPAAVKPAPAPVKTKPKTPFDDSLDLPPAKPKPAAAVPTPIKAEEPDFEEFFAAEEDDDAEFIFADGDDDDDLEDEFIFSDGPNDKLFDEDEQEEGLGELSDSFLNLHSGQKTAPKADHFQQEIHQSENDDFDDDDEVDESWAESILQEMEQEEQQKKAVFDTEKPREPEKAAIEVESVPIEPEPIHSILDFDDDDFSIPQSASQIVSQASEEIEHDFPFEDRFHKLRPLGWLLIVLLTVGLVAQLAWMERETYARMDQWRGIYQAVCDRIGCTLPDQVDLNSIRTSVLVREHKDTSLSDIYVVDVILTNKAPFKQSFPALVLQYTDVNGKLIADQIFQPKQYLKGEMTGVEQMPINTRIYVALAIKKPSANAVNYQLLLTPASN
ncbi:DUF3426 domain-containing protein [Reinekea marinisedimentorum]|uniref:Putative Zn finger-like uncharacterized protein n=1 Tax=Reinekea marinisedimentorum TaxID=230495 RepID=A0A4R3I8T1_9GAMM|nr:DUF3426 domain-containing protein [Reinekea marinisedimentorum]TCS41741.1 putative Zn finger-like uncharacterized protein [Reinekea marinisedimentorum]